MAELLSKSDVAKLMSDSSTEARSETAEKIASQFGGGELSDKEREIAEEIFRVMVKDAEVRVRQALSKQLKDSDNVPHDAA